MRGEGDCGLNRNPPRAELYFWVQIAPAAPRCEVAVPILPVEILLKTVTKGSKCRSPVPMVYEVLFLMQMHEAFAARMMN